jgi:hypothetical protein
MAQHEALLTVKERYNRRARFKKFALLSHTVGIKNCTHTIPAIMGGGEGRRVVTSSISPHDQSNVRPSSTWKYFSAASIQKDS